ncbi:MAG: hypothetical protein R3C05_19820 [Pirellulaceae bacterium]
MKAARNIGLSLLTTVLAVGCSDGDVPRLVPVQGKVLKEGKAITAGSIYLHPDANAEYTEDNPSSILQIDGGFTMKTYPFGEGVAPGGYTVTLAPELAQRVSKPNYGSPEKSPWKISVPPEGLTELVLEIE